MLLIKQNKDKIQVKDNNLILILGMKDSEVGLVAVDLGDLVLKIFLVVLGEVVLQAEVKEDKEDKEEEIKIIFNFILEEIPTEVKENKKSKKKKIKLI